MSGRRTWNNRRGWVNRKRFSFRDLGRISAVWAGVVLASLIHGEVQRTRVGLYREKLVEVLANQQELLARAESAEMSELEKETIELLFKKGAVSSKDVIPTSSWGGAPAWLQKQSLQASRWCIRNSGISPELLEIFEPAFYAMVRVESGLNPFAKAKTSSAAGLKQFIVETGKRYDLTPEDRYHPYKNACAGLRYLYDNYRDFVEPRLDYLSEVPTERRAAIFTLLYVAHHDGTVNESGGSMIARETARKHLPFFVAFYDILRAQKEKEQRQFAVLHLLTSAQGGESEVSWRPGGWLVTKTMLASWMPGERYGS